jgi:hypothetical protein
MVDDLSRDYVVGNIAAISKPKRYECHFVREPHDPERLGVEPLAIEVDRIGTCISRYRRERYRTLSDRRLGQSRCR